MMRKLVVGTLLVIALASGGCELFVAGAAAGAAGAAGVAYVRGEGRKAYDADLETAFDAAVKAVRDLSFQLHKRVLDRSGGEITARTALDDSVQIQVLPVTRNATEVRVRVGTFGDKRVTSMIFEALEKRLPKPAGTPAK